MYDSSRPVPAVSVFLTDDDFDFLKIFLWVGKAILFAIKTTNSLKSVLRTALKGVEEALNEYRKNS